MREMQAVGRKRPARLLKSEGADIVLCIFGCVFVVLFDPSVLV